jgi:cell division protein FtsW
MISSGGSSVPMTCAALGLLLRVSYELDRAERQVAKLRGDAMQPSQGNIPPTTQPAPDLTRGGNRARPRVEPVMGSGVLGLRKGA